MPALDAAISRLAVKVAGVATDSQQWTAGSYIGCRALIHRPIAQRDFGSMQVSIENQNGADAVSLLDIRVDTVIGDLSDAVRLLSARPCGAIDNGTIASTEGPHSLMRTAFTQFASGQPVALTDLRGLTLALEQERLSPAVMTRELVAEFAPAGVDAPDKKASFDVAIENVLAVLQAAVVKHARNTLIVSSAITVAGLDRGGDHFGARLDEANAPGDRYRRSRPQPTRRGFHTPAGRRPGTHDLQNGDSWFDLDLLELADRVASEPSAIAALA